MIDPTLCCSYVGGPRDGLTTANLPPEFSGRPLTGIVSKLPLSQPHQYSLYAVYVCTSETQVNGFWILEYRGDGVAERREAGGADAPGRTHES